MFSDCEGCVINVAAWQIAGGDNSFVANECKSSSALLTRAMIGKRRAGDFAEAQALLASRTRLQLVILDSCRENPFQNVRMATGEGMECAGVNILAPSLRRKPGY